MSTPATSHFTSPGRADASLNITVMRGGWSAEREVSFSSGEAVIGALRSRGHQVVDLDPPNEHWTLPSEVDVVFIALHGTYGEDGQVQERLESLDIPYTGCDSQASRIAFDKALTKDRCRASGVPVARSLVLSRAEEAWPEGWAPPVVLKPVRQGSSVGLEFVNRSEDLPAALARSLTHGSHVLLEERIVGREVTVGILNGETLPVVEVRPRQGGYDYRNKYTPGATEYLVPAEFDSTTTRRIQSAALEAFSAVGGRDYARVDLMVRPEGTFVVLEVNTLPGMTETSLLPMAAGAVGLGFETLCEKMMEPALDRRRQHARNR